MSIFRRELREVQTPEPNAVPDRAAPDVPDVSPTPDADARGIRHKHHLAIPKGTSADIPRLTGADLKAFVATIPDDATICYVDIGEGRRPVIVILDAGIAIEGRR